MKKTFRTKQIQNRVLYTLIAIFLLICVFVATMGFIYTIIERDAYTDLERQTDSLSYELDSRLVAERNNIVSTARLAENLYATYGVEGLDLMVKNFNSVGLIDNIGILLPNNNLLTRIDITIDTSDYLPFSKESKKGSYISGKIEDITNSARSVIRLAEPITVAGSTVAILYGTIPISSFSDILIPSEKDGSFVFLVDRQSGEFIFDSMGNPTKNISALMGRKFDKKYSFDKLYSDVKSGTSGFTEFISVNGVDLIVRYDPIESVEWQIMYAKPYSAVFAEANELSIFAAVIFFVAIFIMSAYVYLIYLTEKRNTDITKYSSTIRRILLGINQDSTAITDSLSLAVKYGSARSAFFIDTDGEDHHYMRPELASLLLRDEDRDYFIKTLFSFAEDIKSEESFSVFSASITANSKLSSLNPEFHGFLVSHGIKTLSFSAITKKYSSQKSLIGIINPKRGRYGGVLIEKIAVCFAMAVNNKKQFDQTAQTATTDALTGLSNRTSYKIYIHDLHIAELQRLTCIFIDVNELHIINNKHGHSAGDALLLSISQTLKDIFSEYKIFRIGGDEFLIFAEDTDIKEINEKVAELMDVTRKTKKYISVGISSSEGDIDIAKTVMNAETEMYLAKAEYYKNKNFAGTLAEGNQAVITHKITGDRDMDMLLPIIAKKYHGVYRVNHRSGLSSVIITPEYIKNQKSDDSTFADMISRYINEAVASDDQRALHSFSRLDLIEKQLGEEQLLSITYKKVSGEMFKLSVFKTQSEPEFETLWLFEQI